MIVKQSFRRGFLDTCIDDGTLCGVIVLFLIRNRLYRVCMVPYFQIVDIPLVEYIGFISSGVENRKSLSGSNSSGREEGGKIQRK